MSHETEVGPYVDKPVTDDQIQRQWGSDYFAELIRSTGIRYLALNPGASFRGLHDSLVNYLGNTDPGILLCLHEEHSVAIAQGYAKVTGTPMGVVVHSNVGLMHASMAVFNAWCDRVPVLMYGATGPVDAAARRPWIDWIHTAKDQGSLVRDFIKWDDQPASLEAAAESVMRARAQSLTAPCGPSYVCFDVGLQERKYDVFPAVPDVSRYKPASSPVPPQMDIEAAADLLAKAKRPVILAGRVSRSESAWQERVELAEWLGAKVLTDLKTAAAFPSQHPLHVGPPSAFMSDPQCAALREADVVLSLDWIALAGVLETVFPDEACPAQVISVTLDNYIHNSWSMDHHGLPPVDIGLAGEPDSVVPLLLEALKRRIPVARQSAWVPVEHRTPLPDASRLDNAAFAATVCHALEPEAVSIARFNLGWSGGAWKLNHPLDYLGNDGGAGVGSGPGNAIGSALALKNTDRVCVGIIGDGDFVMGCTALWTACHHKIGVLFIIANNRSFYNDELHQERVARQRGRKVENKWIGQTMRDPDIDLCAMAAAQGARVLDSAGTPIELAQAIAQGIKLVREGHVVVVNAMVEPEYDSSMTQGMLDHTLPDRG
jgi:thiamine pyrophosphate-dependent acetolactate synthase large subunit-like protein